MKQQLYSTAVLAGLLLLLPLCAGAKAATVRGENDHLIVPDQRIGPVSLGMSDKDLFKLGTPNDTRPFSHWVTYWYDDMKIFVDAATHSVVFVELFDNDSYHTAEGVKIGSSVQDVETAMGPPDSVQGNSFFGNAPITLQYHSGNLAIGFTKENASMADRPEDTVQTIGIQILGAGLL